MAFEVTGIIMEFSIIKDGQQQGPYSESEIQSMLESGDFQLEDLAWKAGMQEWKPLSEVMVKWSVPPPLSARSHSGKVGDIDR